jgi:hypothetical protein
VSADHYREVYSFEADLRSDISDLRVMQLRKVPGVHAEHGRVTLGGRIAKAGFSGISSLLGLLRLEAGGSERR